MSRATVLPMLLALLLCAAFAAPAHAQPSPEPMLETSDNDVLSVQEVERQEQAGDRRLIRTLQRRLFAKFGRFEFSFTTGIMPNDPFVFYIPVGLRVGYHFNEAFAVELSAAYMGGDLRVESELRDELADAKQDRTRIEDISLLDQQVMRSSLVAMWSPIFGKVSVMNDALIHFDFNLVGGAGFLLTESPIEDRVGETEFNPAAEAILGAGMKFYFGGRYAVRADFRQYIYPKSGDAGGVATPSEIALGFSVFTD